MDAERIRNISERNIGVAPPKGKKRVCPLCHGKGKIFLDALEQKDIGAFLTHVLMDMASGGSPQAAKVLAQMKGLLTERLDIREVIIDAADCAEIRRRVWARLPEVIPERCRGVCPLLQKPLLLPEKLREDTGREQGDNSLGAVEAPSLSS